MGCAASDTEVRGMEAECCNTTRFYRYTPRASVRSRARRDGLCHIQRDFFINQEMNAASLVTEVKHNPQAPARAFSVKRVSQSGVKSRPGHFLEITRPVPFDIAFFLVGGALLELLLLPVFLQ